MISDEKESYSCSLLFLKIIVLVTKVFNHTNLVTPQIFFSVRVNNRVVEGASQFFGEKDWQKVDDGGKLCEEDWKISITVFESA